MMPKNPFGRLPATGDYAVGYCKPPTETRFKPGQSGNPRGRPKGKVPPASLLIEERLNAIILAEAYRPITVNDGVQQIEIPMVQAVFRSIAVKAGKGDVRAQKAFTEIVSTAEAAEKARGEKILTSAIEYKHHWQEEFRRCKVAGLPEPQVAIHPDDLHIDLRIGTYVILGPVGKQAQDELKSLISAQKTHEKKLEELVRLMIGAPDKETKSNIRVEFYTVLRKLKEVKDSIAVKASPECVARIRESMSQ